LKPRMILGEHCTGNNGTHGKLGKIGTFSILGLKLWDGRFGFFVWENLLPVCDFYLKSEQVLLL